VPHIFIKEIRVQRETCKDKYSMLTSISMGLLHFLGKVPAEMIDLIGSAKCLGKNGTSILSQMKPLRSYNVSPAAHKVVTH
jgi:hypothetical protein